MAAVLSLLEILRELLIALRHLLVAELVTILFLLQQKEQIWLPVAFQTLRNLLLTRFHPGIPKLSELMRIVFAGQNGLDDGLSGPRVLVMGDEVRTEENFFRRTITINSFTGRRWSIRSDGGQHLPSPRHFSSAEAEANGLLEELYPRTLGRFGGNGLFHDGSPNAQRVDDLLRAVLHPLGDSPSETGRIHAVPGSGVDGAAGAKHDDGGVGKPEGLPLSACTTEIGSSAHPFEN